MQALGAGVGGDRGSGAQGGANWPRADRIRADLSGRDGPVPEIETIAKKIYRADEVLADTSIREQLKGVGSGGIWPFPDLQWPRRNTPLLPTPTSAARPRGFGVPIREVRLSAGAGFIVVICGEIMTMPGLPRVPSAEVIR